MTGERYCLVVRKYPCGWFYPRTQVLALFQGNLGRMTPQKVFAENIHFLLLPVMLVGLKFLWEVAGPLLFLVVLAAGYGVFVFVKQYKQKKSEITAKQLEASTETLLAELAKDENSKKRKDQAKKVNSYRPIASP